MSRNSIITAVAILLTVSFIVPATFFIAPQRVSAKAGAVTCVGGAIAGLMAFFLPAIGTKDALTGGATTATGVASIADCVQKLVIIPLARQLIHQIIQATTASIINWINGNNGTGQPSFVLNLSLHLQAVSDAVALPFINQIQQVMNPAFASGIASSLLLKYAQGTSVGGFLSTQQSTLGLYTPNQGTFLAGGNWTPAAWFALTTQNNNNPYMIAAAAENKLGSLVAQAQANRRQDLVQGRGFLSWCGPSTSGGSGSSISPTASCRLDGGGEGNVKTPGVAIQEFVKEATNADFASLINPADIDSSIAAIFGAALQQGMNSIFGGTGLFGASQTTSFRPQAITTALQSSAIANSGTITSANTAANAALTRLQAYTTAWNAIGGAAGTAQSSLNSLKFTCTTQSSAADTGLASVNAVLAQAQTALNAVSGTQALALQVQQDAQDTTAAGLARLNTDMQALAAAPPTAADVTSAQVNATVTGGATASPFGSLTVSGGTLVDQMNLINLNATAMITDPVACPVT